MLCAWPHIDACFAYRVRLPIAIGGSVVLGIEHVDPQSTFHDGLLERTQRAR